MKILANFQCQTVPNSQRNAKEWLGWKMVLALLQHDGHTITQIGGSESYEADNWIKRFNSLDELKSIMDAHDLLLANDSFLVHANDLFEPHKPAIVMYSKSDPDFYGYPYNKNILKDRKYLRQHMLAVWPGEPYEEQSFLPYKDVYGIITEYIESLETKT